MTRIGQIINKKIEFGNINSWIDFGTGNGNVVKSLKWNEIVEKKIAIDKFPQEIGDGWEHVDSLEELLSSNWDLFTSFDSIEHLKKTDGIFLLKQINAVFKYKLFVTPRGFLRQDETTHPELIKQNPWQKHLSGWEINDFKNYGYKVETVSDFHTPAGLNKKFDALIAYKID